MHVGATALHYGQSAFEGLKAFTHEDNKVYLFRPDENAKRMKMSADRIMMAPIPEDMFVEACKTVVRDNIGELYSIADGHDIIRFVYYFLLLKRSDSHDAI